MEGIIHSFESLAAVDGVGLRCAVFLAGCPLRCAYCHNPDTWSGAGQKTDAETLVKKIARYKPYFKEDGGVTFSGGEPLLQAEFLQECIPLLDVRGINYAVDTSGAVELSDSVKCVLEKSQMVILDIKFWDDESYIRYTGKNLNKTLEMLNFLESINKCVWIRTVIVPGINDTKEVLDRYIKLVKGFKCIEKYELLGFHTMGFYKYEKLGIKNPLADIADLDNEVKEQLQKYLNDRLK